MTFQALGLRDGGKRKEFAEQALKVKHPSILFAMLDGRDVEPIIWKIIQPEFKKL